MVDDPSPDEMATDPAPPPPRAMQLSLPAPAAGIDDVLVPARMINEWVYCPRLAYLEGVEGEWADSGRYRGGAAGACPRRCRPPRLAAARGGDGGQPARSSLRPNGWA